MIVSHPLHTDFSTAGDSDIREVADHRRYLQETSSSLLNSPRSAHKSRFLPHIKICPPDVRGENRKTRKSRFACEDPDNEVFLSPTSNNSPPRFTSVSLFGSEEKHIVHSGRLYLVRHSGSSSGASTPSSPTPRSPSPSPTRSPCWSPSRSPTRANLSAAAMSPPAAVSPLAASPTHSPARSVPFSVHTSNTPPAPSTPPISSSGGRKVPVFVRVYRCNNDHFAVITRDAAHTARPVYVNLRHCRVIPGESLGRFLLAGSRCDSGNVTEFEAPDLSSLELWLDAFQTGTPPGSPSKNNQGAVAPNSTPPIPRSPALPTLAETDEED